MPLKTCCVTSRGFSGGIIGWRGNGADAIQAVGELFKTTLPEAGPRTLVLPCGNLQAIDDSDAQPIGFAEA